MRIPLSSPDITQTEIDAVVDVLRTPNLSLGPKLGEFEDAIARYVGARHAVAVNSGTSGLHLAVRALGLRAGDEVITTPFSFVASANAILYESATPVFADVDPDTLNIDPERVETAITPRTRAILVVHVFGRPAPMREIMAIARRHGLAVIEDACEAIGAESDGAKVGSIGNAGVFAFYPNKQMTTGEGGAIVTDSDEIAETARMLRNQGRDASRDWYEHVDLGFNYRLSDVNCALGIAQLSRLDAMLAMRARVARGYRERLAGERQLILPDDTCDGRLSWFVYVVRLGAGADRARRDRIVKRMHEAGIGCGRYFAPIHLQPYYVARFGYAPGDFPVCEAAGERAIALPFFNRMTDAQLDEVCETLGGLLAHAPSS